MMQKNHSKKTKPAGFSGAHGSTAQTAHVMVALAHQTVVQEPSKPNCLGVTMVLDVSGSMAGIKLTQAKAGIRELHRLMRPKDTFLLTTFSDDVTAVIKPNGKKGNVTAEKLEQKLQQIQAGQGTHLYDAILVTVRNLRASIEKSQQHAPRKTHKRVFEIFVLTDGEDTSSSSVRAQKLAELRSLLEHPGIPHFHLIVIAVGMTAETERIFQGLCSGKNHLEFWPCMEDGQAAIAKVFDQIRRKVQQVQQTFVKVAVQLGGATVITHSQNAGTAPSHVPAVKSKPKPAIAAAPHQPSQQHNNNSQHHNPNPQKQTHAGPHQPQGFFDFLTNNHSNSQQQTTGPHNSHQPQVPPGNHAGKNKASSGAPPPSSPAKGNFCSHCGQQFAGALAKFCSSCGNARS
eukprot:gnl/Hemi2/21326_TR7086_c0_g1_i1.p1 gnl/Hemi2/21326_TR7086_c0_g1~~gnl/Hemi2/21326_TR7086_c0_g1_i1.p1  ORF type:complete len:401 (+),score=103.59 gnl/Hemi2/21326_TR7086_c0_g1_i1:138-1340(+)